MSNLPGIIASNGLFCDRACQGAGVPVRGVAYNDLKAKRAQTAVEARPGGFLNDYVPFYFGPRAPMLLPYKSGRVTGKPENQDDIIYIISSTEAVAALGLPFAFTDGHPIKEPRAFYADLRQLDQVDFSIMHSKYWNDTDQFPDRKRRRQAEFLVWRALPWQAVSMLAVRTPITAAWVQQLIVALAHKPVCEIHPEWYYDD
ncbi:MAG: DUF4433 domain-containing protein [Actinomycetota bacterium]|nr:DUF4433 domain-containing protein [Actinomycetota bacterium]